MWVRQCPSVTLLFEVQAPSRSSGPRERLSALRRLYPQIQALRPVVRWLPTAFAAPNQTSLTTRPCDALQYAGTHRGCSRRSCEGEVGHYKYSPADEIHHALVAGVLERRSHETTAGGWPGRAGRSLRTLWPGL